jgi:hypothetical protein
MPQVPTHTEDERVAQRRMRSRFLGMAIGVVLALSLWLFVHPSAPRDAVVRHDRSKVHDVLARRSRESVVLAEEPRGPRAEDRAWFISEQDARVLFAVSTRGQRYDAFSAYAHNPNLNYDVAWSEHPRGHWLYRTNSIGLREDGELAVERPDLRVIVTGDSHVDGFCDNADSFPHVLGARLAVAHPSSTVEVINAADGGYSFYNYSGVLAAHLALRPHVFVVTVHGGNDFL